MAEEWLAPTWWKLFLHHVTKLTSWPQADRVLLGCRSGTGCTADGFWGDSTDLESQAAGDPLPVPVFPVRVTRSL